MQEILNWTINQIRKEDNLGSSWLEEKKFEWTPLVVKSLKNILEKNCTVLIITDNDREWFLDYILTNINHKKNNRPNLPFYNFKAFYKNIDNIKSEDDVQLVKDILDISFPNGYRFWYIGQGHKKQSILPKYHADSFLWLLDDELPNSLSLKSNDPSLDIKLLQMFKLYNKTLDAVLFAQINLDS